MIYFYLFILLFMPMQSEEPAEVLISGIPAYSLSRNEQIQLVARVYLSAQQSPKDIKLLPLALENMKQIGISSSVQPTDSGWLMEYIIALKVGGIGNAVLGELQFEKWGLNDEGDRTVTGVITSPGFSVQVVEPTNWPLIWSVAGVILLAFASGAYFVQKQRKAKANLEEKMLDPRIRRNENVIQNMNDQKIAGQWKKAIETGYAAVSGDMNNLARTENLTLATAKNMILNEIADAPGFFRLSEEVHYGGYKANAREAQYAIQTTRQIFDYISERLKFKETQ